MKGGTGGTTEATDPVTRAVPDFASRIRLCSSLGNTDYKMFFPINQNTNKIFFVIAFYGPGVKGHLLDALDLKEKKYSRCYRVSQVTFTIYVDYHSEHIKRTILPIVFSLSYRRAFDLTTNQ